MEVAALIAAAGSGSRLGLGPKAFVRVAERTLLAWVGQALRPFVSEIVVAVTADRVEDAGLEAPGASVVVGADTRQATVARMLDATSCRWVMIHDVARPFVDASTLRAVLAVLPEARAVSVVAPVVDSLIRASDGSAVDRSELMAVQTPQAFERQLLLEAHRSARAAGFDGTDDASLVRRLGVQVELVEGGAHLMKVTTFGDLHLAEAYAAVAGLALAGRGA